VHKSAVDSQWTRRPSCGCSVHAKSRDVDPHRSSRGKRPAGGRFVSAIQPRWPGMGGDGSVAGRHLVGGGETRTAEWISVRLAGRHGELRRAVFLARNRFAARSGGPADLPGPLLGCLRGICRDARKSMARRKTRLAGMRAQPANCILPRRGVGRPRMVARLVVHRLRLERAGRGVS
jgi:hypothetical protein